MFYSNENSAFRLTGVYEVSRRRQNNVAAVGRLHTSIAYRIKGESTFYCGDKTLLVPTGSIIFIPAHVDYIRTSTDERLFILHLQCTSALADNVQVIENAEAFEPFFRKLLSVWEFGDARAYNRAMEILYSLFAALQEADDEQPESVPETIRPGVQMLKSRYRDCSLRIAELADACFISEVYFRKLYRRRFGETPHDTLISLRFQCACELLLSGYYSQEEAARAAGFSDVKYFRTAFKKRLGLTPAEFLAKHRTTESDINSEI